MSGIDGGEHDLGAVLGAAHHDAGLRNHKGIDQVHTQVTQVHVGQHLVENKERGHELAVTVDAGLQQLALSACSGEHHLAGGVQVVAVADVVHISVLTVGMTHDFHLERVDVVV